MSEKLEELWKWAKSPEGKKVLYNFIKKTKLVTPEKLKKIKEANKHMHERLYRGDY